MVTMSDTFRAANELRTGNERPSVKMALWAAILSANSSVVNNERQLAIIRPFARTGLPSDQQELYRLMRGTQGFFGAKCRGLYYVEKLERMGKLAGLEHIGDTYEQQCEWRRRVYDLMHGHGMAWKTISFAAAILSPLTCELVPVDSHVLTRLGYETKASPKGYARYIGIEQQVASERDSAYFQDVPLFAWHWYKWEEHRQGTGASTVTNGAQSHAGLSCRMW